MANAGQSRRGQAQIGRHHNRWAQLAIGIICMGLVANLQYAWTLVRRPDGCQASLGPGGDSDRVHHLHRH